MTMLSRALAFTALCMLAGCDGGAPSTSNAGTPPPHNGTLVDLPAGGGFVEVVKKPLPKGTSVADEVTFYFLKSMTKPITPAPTAGTLTVGKGKVLTLVAKDGGLATPAGPSLLAGGEIEGTLSVEIDGKKLSIPMGVR